jgi:hypothetical protein
LDQEIGPGQNEKAEHPQIRVAFFQRLDPHGLQIAERALDRRSLAP